MASQVSATERVLDIPHKFEFFQAVRELERERLRGETNRETHSRSDSEKFVAVGYDGPPDREVIHFRGLPTLNFPPSPICQAEQIYDDVDGNPTQVELSVTFLSLFGPNGSLPRHYTERILERLRAHDDPTLMEFINLFHHRALSLFYRAWQKHRLTPSVELGRLLPDHEGIDILTRSLMSLCGLSTEHLLDSSHLDIDLLAYYSGHLSRRTGRSEAIQKILAHYFAIPIEIEEFVGRWIKIPEESQTWLQNSPHANCGLGRNTVSGSRVFDQTSLVRVGLGPLRIAQFRRFLPGSESYRILCELLKLLLGVDFDFEVQLILRAEDVPVLELSSSQSSTGNPESMGPRLGVDSWLSSHGFEDDVRDVVFRPTLA